LLNLTTLMLLARTKAPRITQAITKTTRGQLETKAVPAPTKTTQVQLGTKATPALIKTARILAKLPVTTIPALLLVTINNN